MVEIGQPNDTSICLSSMLVPTDHIYELLPLSTDAHIFLPKDVDNLDQQHKSEITILFMVQPRGICRSDPSADHPCRRSLKAKSVSNLQSGVSRGQLTAAGDILAGDRVELAMEFAAEERLIRACHSWRSC